MTPDRILLAVPNISEGRNEDLVERIARHDALLDIHSDPDHNRSVLTYGGTPEPVLDACLAMAARAVTDLDITKHDGSHPRYGVVDVLPLVPYDIDEPSAAAVASELARRLGNQTGVPVHLYGRATPDERQLPDLRRVLRSPHTAHPTAGVICLGVRRPLVAFNVDIDGTFDKARTIARHARTLPGVRALAFRLPSRGLVQVSMNLTTPSITGPRAAFELVTGSADALGCEVVAAEVVGLVPDDNLSELHGLPMRRPARSVEQVLRG